MLSRLVPLLFMALPLLFGCGKKTVQPANDPRIIEGIAGWHRGYCASHGQKLPPDEAAFVAYVEAELKKRGQEFDAATFLVSPRDGQKYVIQYGKGFANPSPSAIVVHEKEGYDGKVMTATQMGSSSEIDAAELPALTAAKP